jgi:hypothetical protein
MDASHGLVDREWSRSGAASLEKTFGGAFSFEERNDGRRCGVSESGGVRFPC